MARKLDKQTEERIRAFLDGKPNLPHLVAVWALRHLDIHVSNNTVLSVRKRFEMPYIQDKRVFNTVQLAKDKGIEINHDFLRKNCPQICEEHRQYLVAQNVTKARKELPPFKVGGIAGVVTQILLAA